VPAANTFQLQLRIASPRVASAAVHCAAGCMSESQERRPRRPDAVSQDLAVATWPRMSHAPRRESRAPRRGGNFTLPWLRAPCQRGNVRPTAPRMMRQSAHQAARKPSLLLAHCYCVHRPCHVAGQQRCTSAPLAADAVTCLLTGRDECALCVAAQRRLDGAICSDRTGTGTCAVLGGVLSGAGALTRELLECGRGAACAYLDTDGNGASLSRECPKVNQLNFNAAYVHAAMPLAACRRGSAPLRLAPPASARQRVTCHR
jgi:hypothetical protein